MKHRSPVIEISGLTPIRSESPSRSNSRPNSEAVNNNARLSDPTGAALKRNSTPITSNSPLSILRGSIDTSGTPGRSKGSPVTALKDAIDRGYLTNGNASPVETTGSHGHDPEGYLQPQNNNIGEEKVRQDEYTLYVSHLCVFGRKTTLAGLFTDVTSMFSQIQAMIGSGVSQSQEWVVWNIKLINQSSGMTCKAQLDI